MEGANGKILDTDDPKIVIKKIHRRHRAQYRGSSLTAGEQMVIQELLRRLCLNEGFKLLFVPRAWGAGRFQYKMERIQVDKPLELLEANSHPVFQELKIFYASCKSISLFPADFELYAQPDGRIAMVDFDKFARWRPTGEVVFPWGLVVDEGTLLKPLGLYPVFKSDIQ
jgi:hypothetical protein